MVIAKIISETSAGGLWIEVWQTRKNHDYLVYCHDYFANGSSEDEYHNRLNQAKIDAEGCLTWGYWDGCDYDEFNDILCVSNEKTSFIIAEFSQVNETSRGSWEIIVDKNSQQGFAEDFVTLLN